MGGDRITHLIPGFNSSLVSFILEEELESSLEQELSSQLSQASLGFSFSSRDDLQEVFEDGAVNGRSEVVCDRAEEVGQRVSSRALEIEAKRRRRCNAYKEVLQSYDQLHIRSKSLKEVKSKILSYTPGRWIENSGGMKLTDYDIPTTTTLLLIGPKGSGKSSIVNRISKVFDTHKFSSARAQVSYNYSDGDGTYFLQECMIPRGSNSFCLYDTRGLSTDLSDNVEMVKEWITKGVRHGELVTRKLDSSSLRTKLRCKARHDGCHSKVRRMVNFVIFVVNGLEVLKSLDTDKGKKYFQMLATTFNCPYLSFRDDKPVVVITHGDLLSLAERALVRVCLGELLGIPPMKQIYEIPESCDQAAELSIAEMLIYALEHADKNLPQKSCRTGKVHKGSVLVCLSLFIILAIAIFSIYVEHARVARLASKSKVHVDWHTIRHLWLE